jgi:hypothetical protein
MKLIRKVASRGRSVPDTYEEFDDESGAVRLLTPDEVRVYEEDATTVEHESAPDGDEPAPAPEDSGGDEGAEQTSSAAVDASEAPPKRKGRKS